MGFRNPITTVDALDTGAANRRVVITSSNSPDGGGEVLLYPSNGVPGSLAAGSDAELGPLVVLSSPPGANGLASSILLHPDGISFATPGDLGGGDWITATLVPGWTPGAQGCRFRRIAGVVFWQFHVVPPTAGAVGQFFIFPPGYQPSVTHWWLAEGGGVPQGELLLTSDGWLSRVTPPDSPKVAFVASGCFPAA